MRQSCEVVDLLNSACGISPLPEREERKRRLLALSFDGTPLGEYAQQLASERLGEIDYDDDTSERNALGHVLVGCRYDDQVSQINRLRPPDPDFKVALQDGRIVGAEVTRAVDRLAKKYIGDIDEVRLRVEETIASDAELEARIRGCHVAFVFFDTLGKGSNCEKAANEIVRLLRTIDLSKPHTELLMADAATFPILARSQVRYALVRTEVSQRQLTFRPQRYFTSPGRVVAAAHDILQKKKSKFAEYSANYPEVWLVISIDEPLGDPRMVFPLLEQHIAKFSPGPFARLLVGCFDEGLAIPNSGEPAIHSMLPRATKTIARRH